MKFGSQFATVARPGDFKEGDFCIIALLREGTFINPKTGKTVWYLEGLDADGNDTRLYVHELRAVPASALCDTKQLLNKKVTFKCAVNIKGQKVWEPFKIE